MRHWHGPQLFADNAKVQITQTDPSKSLRNASPKEAHASHVLPERLIPLCLCVDKGAKTIERRSVRQQSPRLLSEHLLFIR